MIDTHCHPQYFKFDEDREAMLQRAFDAGIKMICVGTDYEMSQKAIELARQHEGMWASVGLHPNDNLDEKYDSSVYEKLAGHQKLVAIGEIGLDYYRTPDIEQQKIQKARFLEQISLAIRLNKPMIIHCRSGSTPLHQSDSGQVTTSAHQDMYDILSQNPDARGVIHSFTGTWTDAEKYLKLGFYIGLNGIITFARDYDESVQNIPLDSILLETDAPYLTPIPHRGKRNEPGYVKYVAEKIAELKKISVEEVENVTDQNAIDLFGLKA